MDRSGIVAGSEAVELYSAEYVDVEILLVEDNPADIELFQRTMTGHYHVTVATTGSEAIQRLLQHEPYQYSSLPNLIVLDLNLPVLSGQEILGILRVNPILASIPVVVFSVSDRMEDIQKTYELGACAYLRKQSSLPETERTLAAFADFWIRQVVFPGLMPVRRKPVPDGKRL